MNAIFAPIMLYYYVTFKEQIILHEINRLRKFSHVIFKNFAYVNKWNNEQCRLFNGLSSYGLRLVLHPENMKMTYIRYRRATKKLTLV